MAEAFGPSPEVTAATEPVLVDGPGSLRRAGLLLGVSTTTANVLGYAFAIVLSRSLGPAQYGALASLLAVGLIGSIPGIALQLVVARSSSRDPESAQAEASRWIRLSVAVGLVLLICTCVLTPVAESYLALPDATPVLCLGLVLLTSTVTGAFQGRLLGEERHGRLSATYIAVAGLRFASGCLAAAAGWSISGAIAGAAVAGLIACVVAAVLAGVPPVVAAGPSYRTLVRDLVTASSSTAAILVLSNVDVVLARHYLPSAASGHYAVGSLFTKGAFWGPHFLAVLAYPRLARSTDRRAALRLALLLTVAIAALAVLISLLAGRFLVSSSVGADYTDIASLAPVFAALGAAMALLQLTIYAGLARGRRVTEVLVWIGIATEIVAVTTRLHGSPGQIVTTCLVIAGVVTVASVTVELIGEPLLRSPDDR
jgi:O-antigen/teichoic acid export membrane protein